MMGRVTLVELGLVKAHAAGAGQHEREVRTARGLVNALHHAAVLDDGDAGGATADIHHGAIARTDEQICGRGLVKDGNHVEPRSLGDVLTTPPSRPSVPGGRATAQGSSSRPSRCSSSSLSSRAISTAPM